MRKRIEVGGKTYKVYTIDCGSGPTEYIDVLVATPGGVIVSHIWRPIPRGGPTWVKVMKAAEKVSTSP